MNNPFPNKYNNDYNFQNKDKNKKNRQSKKNRNINEEEYIDMRNQMISNCQMESLGPDQFNPFKSIFFIL